MQDWILSGDVIDFVLVFIGFEVLLLLWWRRRYGGGLSPLQLASLIAPGLCIFLALQAALTDAGWQSIAGWLVASLVSHLIDVRRRWREVHNG